MSWQVILLAQVIASSFVALWTRHIALVSKKTFFSIGAISYFTIALCGLIISLVTNKGLPMHPTGIAWLYIAIEGFAIPIAWLFQYKLMAHIGASNTVVVTTINTIGAALLGIVFLGEDISATFIIGALFILSGVYISLTIQPDKTHHVKASLTTKSLLVLGSFIFFSIGMFFEKKAINSIGVWNYAFFGWMMQCIGASIIYLFFGKAERKHVNPLIIKKAIWLGIATSVAGGLFILALSKGTLSHTIVATSGRVAITMLLAAIFLNENNNMKLRLSAFISSMLGIAFILF